MTDESERLPGVAVADVTERLAGQTDGRVNKRLIAVWEYLEGASPAEIEARYRHQEGTVEEWLDIVATEGLDALVASDRDVAQAGTVDDSERHAHTEAKLRALQTTTRELMAATTTDEIVDVALDACVDVLGLPLSVFWLHVEDEDALDPYSQTEIGRVIMGPLPSEPFERGEGLVWQAVESGEVRYWEDLWEHEADLFDPDTDLRSEIDVPLGEYGALGMGSMSPSEFDEVDVDMCRILGRAVESAFDRLERERQIRRHERDLTLLKTLLARFLRHNLRNEVAVIQGNAEVIGDRAEEVADLADRIVEASTVLVETSEKARLIETLVDTDPSPSEQRLATVVEEAVDAVDVPPGATVERDVPGDLTVLAVPQLSSAVENLVENAVVHGGDAPTVAVSASRDGGTVELVVADDGPGISREEVAVLERSDETQLSHGSGMGLWVVDWVVEASGGTLSFDADDGTRVVVRLQTPDDA